MAHQPPPVPPDQQSDALHGEGGSPDRKPEVKTDPAGGTSGLNLREQGHEGDIAQNTHNQGYQQDR
jgi:hypothetical protein